MLILNRKKSKNMNVYIRTDSSIEIGTGHVMRCLVLAEQLRKRNAEVIFICRNLNGSLIPLLKDKGFPVKVLPSYSDADINMMNWMETNWQIDAKETANKITERKETVDWLIIDHYGIDVKWEQFVRPFVKHMMVIDDLANRPHDCDLILDQNLYPNMENRYDNLVPKNTKKLLGIRYVLLREEFFRYKNFYRKANEVNKILISFGGSDPTNETLKVIKAVESLYLSNVHVEVVIGYSNPHRDTIRTYCQHIPYIRVHENIQYISTLMKEADIAIGSGGSSSWERCFMCLPTITIETATNQTEILTYLSNLGAICHLGKSEEVDEKLIAKAISIFINDIEIIQQMIFNLNDIKEQFDTSAVVDELFSIRQSSATPKRSLLKKDEQGGKKDVE